MTADLAPAFLRLDLRLRLVVEKYRAELTERARDPFRGLYISETEVDELLSSAPTADLAREVLEPPAALTSSRLARLATLFGLRPFEQDVMIVCVAPDIDLRYERLYAYLQDDVTRRRPTVDLVLRLLTQSLDERAEARAMFASNAPLLGHCLLSVVGEEASSQLSLLARPLRVDERIVEYLLGSDRPDPRVEAFGKLTSPDLGAQWRLPDNTQLAGLVDVLRVTSAERPGAVIYVHGAPGSGKRATIETLCASAGRPLLTIDLPGLLAATPERMLAGSLAAIVREAVLQEAVLCLDGFDAMLRDDTDTGYARGLLQRLLRSHRGDVLLLGESRWEPALWLTESNAIRLELGALSIADRVRLWRCEFDGTLSDRQVSELAGQFRLTDTDTLRAVANDAASRAHLRGAIQMDIQDVRSAARAMTTPPLDELARHIVPRYTWDDMVLPADGLAQLREMCARLRHRAVVLERWGYGRKHARRQGITALFSGQPGTGKTMAAEIIACELGLDLFRIDLSAVVSKYIGETEKNLEKIFTAADQGEAVLLFDEADAIFGKRSEVRDARDRYANVEVAYLLQRLEAYDGLAVLTTNLLGSIDNAFLRRLDCVLEFPLPEEPERLRIWRLALPGEAPLGPDVDLPFLARKFKLAGGHIRNIALTGAFLAAEDGDSIRMRHLARATRREYQKLGKLVAESDFEQYFALLKD